MRLFTLENVPLFQLLSSRSLAQSSIEENKNYSAILNSLNNNIVKLNVCLLSCCVVQCNSICSVRIKCVCL